MLLQKLNRKRVKEINRKIEKRFGVNPNFRGLFSEGNWIYIYTGTENLTEISGAVSAGLNIGKFRDEFMPTIEGAQIINPGKNYFMLKSSKDALTWMQGNDLFAGDTGCEVGYVIVISGDDILGSGMYDGRIIRNRLAKNRKLKM